MVPNARRYSLALRLAVCGFVLASISPSLRAETATPPEAAKLEEARDLLEQGNPKEAVKAFKEAGKLAGGPCVECSLGLAKAYNKLGAYKEAQKVLTEVFQGTEDKGLLAIAYAEQGMALFLGAQDDPKRYPEAEAAYRKVLELSGGTANMARYNLAVVLLRMERDAEGVALLKEYLDREPDARFAGDARELIENPVRARKRLVPDFEVATLSGDYLTTEGLRGKVVLLDFWATWCTPCVQAIPGLRRMSRQMDKDPFVLLSLSVDQDTATLKSFVAQHQMTWPQVWDERSELSHKMGVSGFPTYLLVSHEGEIVYSVSGWGTRIEQELASKVAAAVRAAKKSAKKGKEG
jgi:thioredoxin-like negative regulator of GroEL